KTKISKEKTKQGKELYSPIDMNNHFQKEFQNRGFKELRDTYTIKIPNSDVAISGAYKQVDFVKEKVLVEVQFGKYAFMFYDMAKFQYFFNENKADVGIEIVPCHSLHKGMSSGVSYGEQLVYDIERLKRHFPAVPVKVILVDVD
ncbi:MAG: BglII/BstYI family type II restriction endonuclease, partial [Anaerolineales bacterium]|nr:BglII/BstYI family type II restriction endonuclease [Anaerolineales bacterium]